VHDPCGSKNPGRSSPLPQRRGGLEARLSQRYLRSSWRRAESGARSRLERSRDIGKGIGYCVAQDSGCEALEHWSCPVRTTARRSGTGQKTHETFTGALASALGGFEAKESLAFLHEIEFVARDQTQILRTGPQKSLLTFVPLQNGLLFRQLIFQILNLRPHFISARSLWKITNCKSGDNEQNDDRSDRPV
jgi:hypothetical protein